MKRSPWALAFVFLGAGCATMGGSRPSETQAGGCNVSKAPNLAPLARRVAALCKSALPGVAAALGAPVPATPIQIVFADGMTNAGETTGTLIRLNAGYFARHPDDLGAIVHEMAHVVQHYPNGGTFWLTEGIADYARARWGRDADWKAACAAEETYLSGYRCAAAFLLYLQRRSPGTVEELNQALAQGRYPASVFRNRTGLELDALWSACLRRECKGGKPLAFGKAKITP